jgi:hypothetical protein
MKLYKVLLLADIDKFEDALNEPPEGFHLHSWQVANNRFVVVFKRGQQ